MNNALRVNPTSGPLASTAIELDPTGGRLQHRSAEQLEDAAERALDAYLMPPSWRCLSLLSYGVMRIEGRYCDICTNGLVVHLR